MEWIRILTSWDGHPKTLDLPLSAKGLWLDCAAWVGRHETDGRVPIAQVMRIAGQEEGRVLSADLVEAELWEPEIDSRGAVIAYRFHDWLNIQKPREAMDQARAKGRERWQRWNAKRTANAVSNGVANALLTHQEGEGEGDSELLDNSESTLDNSESTNYASSLRSEAAADQSARLESSEPAPSPQKLGRDCVAFYVDECRRLGIDPIASFKSRIGREARSLTGKAQVDIRAAITRAVELNKPPNALPYLLADIERERNGTAAPRPRWFNGNGLAGPTPPPPRRVEDLPEYAV